MHRDRLSLASAGQILCFLGNETAIVSDVLDLLEREKFIERSQPLMVCGLGARRGYALNVTENGYVGTRFD